MITNKKRVYVVGAYGNAGASIMSYHLAKIIYEHFGYDCIVVRTSENEIPQNSIFEYPIVFDSINFEELELEIKFSDYLISNPANSHRFLGCRLPGKKLMYVQAYTTFNVLDGFFDEYVSVSNFVSNFLKHTYGINSRIIHPFVRRELIPQRQTPWIQRPEEKILVMGKRFFNDILSEFESRFLKKYSDIPYEIVKVDRCSVTQPELFGLFLTHRYFMQLSPCEGFGLTPLEAMGCGCTVLGFHGGGGLDYLRPNYNCGCVYYPNIDDLCDILATVMKDKAKAEKLASRGSDLIKNYSYEKFENSFLRFFQEFFSKKSTKQIQPTQNRYALLGKDKFVGTKKAKRRLA